MPDLKPDLGYYLLEKFGEEVVQHFYSVKFFHIIHVGHNNYSFTSNASLDDHEFAATFDFDIIQFRNLLDQIEDHNFRSFINNRLNKEFTTSEQVDFYETPLIVDIDGEPGAPVNSLYEKFVPILVSKFSNLSKA